MTKRYGLLSVAVVVVLAVAAVILIFDRSTRSGPDLADVRYSYGPPPTSEGATYVVSFDTVDPNVGVGDDVREVTTGQLSGAWRVSGQAVRQGTATSDSAATYFEKDFQAPVTRMGVQAVLPQQAGKTIAVAMIVADGPLPSDFSGNAKRPNAGIHLVLTSQEWQLGVWSTTGTLQVIATGAFDVTKFSGPVRYEVQREGSTARVIAPDGKIAELSDDRIDQFSGSFGTWEMFQQGQGAVSPEIQAWWAQ